MDQKYYKVITQVHNNKATKYLALAKKKRL